ncbi:PaaX family transcriptional regulator C-terminal domain-containing protein [Amycolatopsis decaplanina]|uniref:PaaX family transcriptional regulator n=1 Tax=Amycolatopsis decaplanina DSM 44594 TaxID=1284240 RepID=M2ZL76_9PSEU|nr:PaaX family transcriptional regulator C-terminal domain-containing protein [Amycolatopsis decaplanina]EME61653.1 PaaX family transcriptional regulator [Amycolatopsis decaplanina DSM 44594]
MPETTRSAKPTGSAELVRKAFDTERIRARYLDFLVRWVAPSPDDFTRRLMLHTDWLHVIRRDPHLPAEHLPDGRPAARAERLFRKRDENFRDAAAKMAEDLREVLAVSGSADPVAGS